MSEANAAAKSQVIPHLIVKGASDAIDFYVRAFGAVEIHRMEWPTPTGEVKLGHAAIQIGSSMVMLADEFPEHGGLGPQDGRSPVTLHLQVADADALFEQAVGAGATVTMPLADMFWGDRYGKLVDPFGHHWSIAHQLEQLTPEQLQERMLAAVGSEGDCL